MMRLKGYKEDPWNGTWEGRQRGECPPGYDEAGWLLSKAFDAVELAGQQLVWVAPDRLRFGSRKQEALSLPSGDFKGLLNTDLSEGQYLTRVMSPRREEKGNVRCIPHYGA